MVRQRIQDKNAITLFFIYFILQADLKVTIHHKYCNRKEHNYNTLDAFFPIPKNERVLLTQKATFMREKINN